MKAYDFINSHIGQEVYITGHGDLAMDGQLRPLIFNKTKLILVKLTKKGYAQLQTEFGRYYTVPPRNVRLYSELILENENNEE